MAAEPAAAEAMDVEAPARPTTTTSTVPTSKGKSPHDLLAETRASVEEVAARILAIKKDDAPRTELRELVAQMSLLLITLRQVCAAPESATPLRREPLALDLLFAHSRVWICAGEQGDTDGGGQGEGGDGGGEGARGLHDEIGRAHV